MAKKEKSYDEMHFEELRLKLTEKMLNLGTAVPYLAAMPVKDVEQRLKEALEVFEEFSNRFRAPVYQNVREAQA